MPAFLTHYSCGLLAYRALEDGDLKQAIRRHAGVYNIGLAGPDLFFYSIGEQLCKGMTVGRVMHKYRTGRFLQTMFSYAMRLEGESRWCALAYLSGFLGHYSLDSNAHYLVYRVCDVPDQRQALGKHFRYEAAMDGFCCKEILGRPIGSSHQMGLIRTTGKERRIMAELLQKCIAEVYPDLDRSYTGHKIRVTLAEYFVISGLLMDPTGFKEWMYLLAERKIVGYPWMSPLFINDHAYGLTDRDWERFKVRFDRGVRMNRRLLKSLVQTLRDFPQNGAADLIRSIGSRSYHGFYHEEADCALPLAELEERMFQREKSGRVLP